MILSLLLQLALDHARLSRSLIVALRWVAPLAAVLVSGVACVSAATVLTGIGLVRSDSP